MEHCVTKSLNKLTADITNIYTASTFMNENCLRENAIALTGNYQ